MGPNGGEECPQLPAGAPETLQKTHREREREREPLLHLSSLCSTIPQISRSRNQIRSEAVYGERDIHNPSRSKGVVVVVVLLGSFTAMRTERGEQSDSKRVSFGKEGGKTNAKQIPPPRKKTCAPPQPSCSRGCSPAANMSPKCMDPDPRSRCPDADPDSNSTRSLVCCGVVWCSRGL